MIDWHTLGLREIVFTWVDPDTGKQTTFATDRIIKAAENLEVIYTNVTIEGAKMIAQHRGLERYRLDRITGTPDDWPPATYLWMPDDTHLLIDGNHRYFKAALLGYNYLRTHMVPQSIWEQYTVNFPQVADPTGGWSGIL